MAPGIQIVAPTIVRYSFVGHLPGGHTVVNKTDVSLDEFGETRTSALDTLNPKVVKAYQDNILAMMTTAYTFDHCHWTDLDSLDGRSGDIGPQSGSPTTGASSNPACPPGVCMLVQLHCGHTRRQRGGRMFVPAIQEGVVDDAGNMTTTFHSFAEPKAQAYRTAINALTDTVGLETVAMRVVHIDKHRGSGEPPTDPSTWTWDSTDVDSVSLDFMVATQRRRQR